MFTQRKKGRDERSPFIINGSARSPERLFRSNGHIVAGLGGDLVEQAEALLLESFGPLVAGRFGFRLDPVHLAVHLVIVVGEARESELRQTPRPRSLRRQVW